MFLPFFFTSIESNKGKLSGTNPDTPCTPTSAHPHAAALAITENASLQTCPSALLMSFLLAWSEIHCLPPNLLFCKDQHLLEFRQPSIMMSRHWRLAQWLKHLLCMCGTGHLDPSLYLWLKSGKSLKLFIHRDRQPPVSMQAAYIPSLGGGAVVPGQDG